MTEQRWRKSSRSQTEGACVALNGTRDSVRDTKNDATLTLTQHAVAALVITARACRAQR